MHCCVLFCVKDADEVTEKEIKVDKWDSSSVRNALEDATKEVQRTA